MLTSGGLANQRGVVDQTVLGRVVLSLQSTEQSLLGTQNLDSGTGALSELEERASMGNQAGTNELTNKLSQVGSNGLHSRSQIQRKLLALVRE